jgi:predicted ATPase with chaperone activity
MNQLDFTSLPIDTLSLPTASGPPSAVETAWVPAEPRTLSETGLDEAIVEGLVLKLLSTSGPTIGRRISEQIRLPFGLVAETIRGLKSQMLVSYKSQATMGDFEYELTEDGHRKARREIERCTYCGAAPVRLDDYVASVERQSVRLARPKLPAVAAALSGLSLSPTLIAQIGQAVYAGRSLFLYGAPGNGKSSIAERTIKAISQHIWIPRTLTVTGEIIRLFDPANHVEAPLESGAGTLIDKQQYDRRWVRIERPSIVVGGELRLEQLEITHSPATGIIESPIQLKSNCGALVIDDLGRQRCGIEELLNRWIVPLENGRDYLRLPSGRQIEVPFDQLLIFSTNLQPARLLDEAFLRRIAYKIEVSDPSPREFRDLCRLWCGKLGIEYHEPAVDQLLSRHFSEIGRPMRYCHPRDLMQQVRAFCEFHDQPLVLTSKALDLAVRNYFAGL